MLSRRTFLLTFTVLATRIIAPIGLAQAGTHAAWSQQAFDDAQKAGRPILVEITASWCPTCRAQKKVMGTLLNAPELHKLAIFEVDFDTQKDVVRAFDARMQSTLITFKGNREVGRSVGETNANAIKKLLDTTIWLTAMLAGLSFSFIAGILSTLSPCVLPLVPIVLGAAISQHRLGPVALAAGLAISFSAIGLFVATIGFSIGLDGSFFKEVAATLMLAIGVVLIMPAFQARLSTAVGPSANWVARHFGGFSTTGLTGQFCVGLLLGAVWSPCVGPTLGAASVLAARGTHLEQVVVTMMLFGIGAAVPLLILGLLSREALQRWRSSLASVGMALKVCFGFILVLTAAATFSGLDKSVETLLVNISPDWLTDLTTRF
jgi:cytochrome c-type biogenesis protein